MLPELEFPPGRIKVGLLKWGSLPVGLSKKQVLKPECPRSAFEMCNSKDVNFSPTLLPPNPPPPILKHEAARLLLIAELFFAFPKTRRVMLLSS